MGTGAETTDEKTTAGTTDEKTDEGTTDEKTDEETTADPDSRVVHLQHIHMLSLVAVLVPLNSSDPLLRSLIPHHQSGRIIPSLPLDQSSATSTSDMEAT